jgi:hypothetical protein
MYVRFQSSFSRNFNFNLLQCEACIIIHFTDSVLCQENISMRLSDTTRQTAPPTLQPNRPHPTPPAIIHRTKSSVQRQQGRTQD